MCVITAKKSPEGLSFVNLVGFVRLSDFKYPIKSNLCLSLGVSGVQETPAVRRDVFVTVFSIFVTAN